MRLPQTLIALAVGAVFAASANAAVVSSGSQSFSHDSFLLFGDSFTSSFTTNDAVLDVDFSPTVNGSLSNVLLGLFDVTAGNFLAFNSFSSTGFLHDGPRKVGFDYSFDDLSLVNGHNYLFGVLALGNDYSGTFSYTLTSPVPEPETYALMGLGLAALIARRRKAGK
ncbi:hypothetical protein GCM10007860_10710 [Chitiniphilus shinanonensis]|uniref:Ice-binding protein C-terminal domain-containing protein n=1 Tax=Chitiniphilus shinanonensis TaxID=553088 RepID=A0ABQ6BTQ3_9NEIS|nr:PEP-CTERM sorting domain-containing protein [Chitiniphilus shinanonensis]GLS03926.1 hypothetical protein GCM10007860_10710 [Chitiniphilus shinanonensis]